MNRLISPSTIAAPAANYAHAMVVHMPDRTLHTSGVVPIAPDGSVPHGVAEQASVVWDNLLEMLAEAEMSAADVVVVTTYVVASELDALGSVMVARDRALGGHLAASTLVTVPMLARPEWKVEIALVAAR